MDLEEADALNVAGELVVELGEFALLLLAVLGDGDHGRILGLEGHAATVQEAAVLGAEAAGGRRVDGLDDGAAGAAVAARDGGGAGRDVRLVAVGDGGERVVEVG